jgi:DNA-binding response OmpR family regulator
MPSILIIDDQPYMHELCFHVLTKESYQVVSAGSVESVRRYLEDSIPDIVLLEISLHGFEGWSVLYDIKRKYPHLPVLIVTAYDSFVHDPRVSQAEGYVVKDFIHVEGLKEKVTQILERKGFIKPPYSTMDGQTASPLSQLHKLSNKNQCQEEQHEI